MGKQTRHIRTSKKGKRFLAGRKKPKRKIVHKPKSVWSAVLHDGDGYASSIQLFDTEKEAVEFVEDRESNWCVVKGTQMWNEPVGQTEEEY